MVSTSDEENTQKNPDIDWRKLIKEKFNNYGWIKNKENLTMLLTAITALLAMISAMFSYVAIQEAKESTIIIKKIAEWNYNPIPQMDISTNVDFEQRDHGFVYVNDWEGYKFGKGLNINTGGLISIPDKNGSFHYLPSYSVCCKNIKISVYNSGRRSIISPIVSFGLEAKNKSNGILFKIHTVRTPIDKMEYDPERKTIFESFKPEINPVIEIPYVAMNNDFPPYLDEKGNSYFVIPDFSKDLLPTPWEDFSDKLGPFRIGSIQPDQSVEIELKIFATERNCNDGFLNITIQSRNTNTTNRTIELRTGSNQNCDKIPIEEFIRLYQENN